MDEEIIIAILFILLYIALIIAGIALYFLPSIIAYRKGHMNRKIILLINFLLGWTFLGWACSLVWAFFDTDGKATNNVFRGNKFNELEKLRQLKENGTITEEEFKEEKKKILN